jgi:hypothetical protein
MSAIRGIISDREAYKKTEHTYDAKKQARAIWKTVVAPQLKKGLNVALLYSANNNQAETIYEGYETDSLDEKFSGVNMAELFRELAQIIRDKKLEKQVHIVPIATSLTGGDNVISSKKKLRKRNYVSLEMINRDLENIARHIGAGWPVFGLKELNKEEDHWFSIGGGVSTNWNTTDQIWLTCNPVTDEYTLETANLKQDLQAPDDIRISQGTYVRHLLGLLSDESQYDIWPENLKKAYDEGKALIPAGIVAAVKTGDDIGDIKVEKAKPSHKHHHRHRHFRPEPEARKESKEQIEFKEVKKQIEDLLEKSGFVAAKKEKKTLLDQVEYKETKDQIQAWWEQKIEFNEAKKQIQALLGLLRLEKQKIKDSPIKSVFLFWRKNTKDARMEILKDLDNAKNPIDLKVRARRHLKEDGICSKDSRTKDLLARLSTVEFQPKRGGYKKKP